MSPPTSKLPNIVILFGRPTIILGHVFVTSISPVVPRIPSIPEQPFNEVTPPVEPTTKLVLPNEDQYDPLHFHDLSS